MPQLTFAGVAAALTFAGVAAATKKRNARYAAAAGEPRRRPLVTLLSAERPPGRREGAGRGRSEEAV
jgi:hypothetical protein